MQIIGCRENNDNTYCDNCSLHENPDKCKDVVGALNCQYIYTFNIKVSMTCNLGYYSGIDAADAINNATQLGTLDELYKDKNIKIEKIYTE